VAVVTAPIVQYPWRNDAVKGKPVFVIGGGPSFDDFQPHWLDWRYVICVNRMVHKFANTNADVQAVVTLHADHAPKYAVYGWPVLAHLYDGMSHNVHGFDTSEAISKEPGKLLTHCSSAGAAINLALIWGASMVYTVGVDFAIAEGGRVHCYGYGPTPKRVNDGYTSKPVPMKAALEAAGVRDRLTALHMPGGVVPDVPWLRVSPEGIL
jgi:hypothetical protein